MIAFHPSSIRQTASPRQRLTPLLAACVAVLGTQAARAATITLEPAADASLYEDGGSATANGAGEVLVAGRTNQASNSRRRSLLRFDVSSLPQDASLTSVSLQLFLLTVTTADTDLSLHRITAPWTEGPADPLGTETTGIAAVAGDVTWRFASFDTTLWTSVGGDASDTASATSGVTSASGVFTWSSPGLVADVAAWAADPATNFGWLLRADESTPQTAKRFASSENPTLEWRPRLTIEFTPVPEPSAATLLMAGFGLLWRRSRTSRRG